MGIDPLTHQPLLNTNTSQNSSSSQSSDQSNYTHESRLELLVPLNTNIVDPASSQNSSSPPTDHQNCGAGTNVVDGLCDQLIDTSLISFLFEDDDETTTTGGVLVDKEAPWGLEFSDGTAQNVNSVDDEWLLDCQDFGVHDFEFDLFNDLESRC